MTDPEALLRAWVDAADAGRLDSFEDYLHHDLVVHAPLGLSTKGIDEERAVWRDALAAMPGIRHAIQEVVVQGDTVVARVVVTGVHEGDFAGIPRTGRSFTIDQVLFAHLRDGKIVELWEIVDTAALLSQLGVLAP
ncbi:MAG TPA: ester cyclase [Mycobacteriales bacterium]|nr:ester cyclase [Mycobacteriales bacterium]